MAGTPIFTMQQYQALCAAIGQGVTKVKYGDKEVEYRTLSEMIRVKSMMESDLGITNPNNRIRYASHTKGLI